MHRNLQFLKKYVLVLLIGIISTSQIAQVFAVLAVKNAALISLPNNTEEHDEKEQQQEKKEVVVTCNQCHFFLKAAPFSSNDSSFESVSWFEVFHSLPETPPPNFS